MCGGKVLLFTSLVELFDFEILSEGIHLSKRNKN